MMIGVRRFAVIAAALALEPTLAAPLGPTVIPNAGFEEGEPDAPPPGWRGTKSPQRQSAPSIYQTIRDTNRPYRGAGSGRLEGTAARADPGPPGVLAKEVDATPFRGRRVRLTAAVRADAPQAQHVGLWLRVDRTGNRRGFFDNMAGRPIRSSEWVNYVLEGDVSADAERIVFGTLLIGAGKVWSDEFRLEDVGAGAPSPDAAALSQYLDRALTLLRDNHINSGSTDWARIEADARAKNGDAREWSDTYDVVQATIRALGEPHTYVRLPATGSQGDGAAPSMPTPMPQPTLVGGNIGKVVVPFFMGSEEEGDRYASALREGLVDLDRRNVCGWIVDLRGNVGGNMWPMLSGLGPLLGKGPFGSFRAPSDKLSYWVRKGDAAILSDTPEDQAPSVALREADAPVAVLIDAQTGSSGEFTAMSLIGRPRTRSFGASTAGLTTGNTPFDMPDGGKLVITTSYARDRAGNEQKGALKPDELAEGEQAVAAATRWLRRQGCR